MKKDLYAKRGYIVFLSSKKIGKRPWWPVRTFDLYIYIFIFLFKT